MSADDRGESVPPSGEPYRIRLRGPWQVAWLGDGPVPPAGSGSDSAAVFERHRMPAEWRQLFGERSGTALFRRVFHAPTGMEPGDRICIRLPPAGGPVQVRLNGSPLPVAMLEGIPTIDVTGRLEENNQLEVAVTFRPADNSGTPGGLWQPVVLEILPAR